MQKIIIDTNVIISGLISKGIPSQILNKIILENKVQYFISPPVYTEYLDVLQREKFAKFKNFQERATHFLAHLTNHAILVNAEEKYTILKDIDDNKFLDLAVEVKADFLITGNTRDFTIDHIETTKIVTPTEFWELFQT